MRTCAKSLQYRSGIRGIQHLNFWVFFIISEVGIQYGALGMTDKTEDL